MSSTLILIVITAVISVIGFSNSKLLHALMLWPQRMRGAGELYRLLTAGFVHADYMHLGFNMLTLYFFGQLIEQALGTWLYLLLYLLGIVVSCVPSWLKRKDDPYFRSLGASGGVAAVIFAMIYLSPWQKLYIFFAIGMPSILFAILYLGYTAYMARQGKGIVNHDAHLWGSVFGFVFMWIVDPTHGRYFLDQLLHPAF